MRVTANKLEVKLTQMASEDLMRSRTKWERELLWDHIQKLSIHGHPLPSDYCQNGKYYSIVSESGYNGIPGFSRTIAYSYARGVLRILAIKP